MTNPPKTPAPPVSGMREQFEAWALNKCLETERLSDGRYAAYGTGFRWEAWQAAFATLSAPPADEQKPVAWPPREPTEAKPGRKELTDAEIEAAIRKIWRELTHASNVHEWAVSASEIAIARHFYALRRR